MNTPAHVAVSTLIWRNESGWPSAAAVAGGAILPDAPMYVFYAWQKLVVGSSEHDIWTTLYFQDSWQLFFDIFNSIPLMLLLIGVSWWFDVRWGVLLFSSALVHLFCDFPVHNDDGHRHFLPFTHWRFASPVSYWDPKHFGRWFMAAELLFSLGACMYVVVMKHPTAMRTVAGGTLALYAVGIVFALIMWSGQLRQ